MAQWKERLEPYTKVIESVKTAPLNPTAGEDLVIGAVIISDAGSCTPQLISGLKNYLANYAGADLTQDYTNSLNKLYTSDKGSNLASTMWLNAYRLAGSANLLVMRASKAGMGNYIKPLNALKLNGETADSGEYIIKDTEILKKTNPFRLSIDVTHKDGWAISINEVGILGNLVDDNGPVYDYLVESIPDLVDQLNETSKFFCPNYTLYKIDPDNSNIYIEVSPESVDDSNKNDVVAVMFNEVYMAPNFLDTTWNETGYAYIFPTTSIIYNGSDEISEDTEYVIYYGSVDKPEGVLSSVCIANLTVDDLVNNANTFTLLNGESKDVKNIEVTKGIIYFAIPKTVGLSRVYYLSVNDETKNNLIVEEDFTKTTGVMIDDVEYVSYATYIPMTTELNPTIMNFSVAAPNVAGLVFTGVGDLAVINSHNINKYTKKIVDLNNDKYSDFEPNPYYVSNVYNTSSKLKVRIRRLNHNACSPITTSDSSTTPWKPNELILKNYTKNGKTPDSGILKYDFYEVAVLDPGIGNDWQLFNIGNIGGRGDITTAELNNMLSMIKFNFPDNMLDLGLNYWNGTDKTSILDEFVWTQTDSAEDVDIVDSVSDLYTDFATSTYDEMTANVGKICYVNDTQLYYKLTYNGGEQIVINNLDINPDECSLLNVSDSDIMKAWDAITEDERYIVEGICDCGNTYSIIQNYMANIAVNSNYFYPISCAYSSNYLTIASKAGKITKDTNKIWFGGNYDIDDGTVGYKFNFGTSGLFWESVCRNKTNNNEFAGVFGQNTGIASVVNLNKEFTKTERQLLLGHKKNINTIYHDLYVEKYYWNDNNSGTSDSNVLSEECNTRLLIRISKAMPVLLNQFKGRQNTAKTWAEVELVIDYWFKNTVMTYNYTVSDYRILCSSLMSGDDAAIRANKLNVKVQVRFNNSIKYITVYNEAYPIGIEFED